jgi:hypothetical protein
MYLFLPYAGLLTGRWSFRCCRRAIYGRRCMVGDVYDPLDAEQQARTGRRLKV